MNSLTSSSQSAKVAVCKVQGREEGCDLGGGDGDLVEKVNKEENVNERIE